MISQQVPSDTENHADDQQTEEQNEDESEPSALQGKKNSYSTMTWVLTSGNRRSRMFLASLSLAELCPLSKPLRRSFLIWVSSNYDYSFVVHFI